MWRVWLILLLLLALPLRAEDLAAMNKATLQALSAGDIPRALSLAEAAVMQPGSAPDRVGALNALAYLLLVQRQDGRAETLALQAQSLAETSGLQRSLGWFQAVQGRIALLQRRGADALPLIDQFQTAGRVSPWAADVMGLAADMLFQAGEYRRMADSLDEMVALGGTLRSATTLDMLYTAQGKAEDERRVADACALIDARITLVRVLQPDLLAQFAHGALWQKFYLNEQAGLYGPAADALRQWASTGQMSADELAFVEAQASASVLYAELASYGEGRVAQLGNAQLALAYTDVLQNTTDLRRARALRALALALSGLGRVSEAGERFQDALRVAEAATGGQEQRYLLLEDLAVNAWQRGDARQAQHLFAMADAAYQVALSGGTEPLGRIDQAIGLQNRARVATGLGDAAAARALMAQAWALFRADQAAGAQKANVRGLEVSLLITDAGIDALSGQGADKARQGVKLAHSLWPQDHPDMAVVLGQAADVLARAGQRAEALADLQQAQAINAATLPSDAPAALEIGQSLAELALLTGDRPAALAALQAAAEGRKSPAYRANLAEGAASFEMLSWALLDQPQPDVDAAFQALQWTQITGSAEALAAMQTRLAASTPQRASLIAQAQQAQLQTARLRSDLMAAYATGSDPAPLRAREPAVAQEMARTDAALTAAGLEMTGLTTVKPAPLAEVQALLAPDEALVTFVLPGLRAAVVPGLAGSSNLALAVTRDAVQVARIPEASRGALNARITAFRCQIALNDPGCGTAGGGVQRGAMVLDAAPLPGFDPSVAQALYRDLFGGIEPVLQGKTHLMLIPPADLLRLPFQALVTGEVGDEIPWLIRRHAISVLPSIPSFATLRRAAPSDVGPNLLAVGDPILSPAAPADCAALGLGLPRSAPSATPDGTAQLDQLRAMPALPDASCELQAIAASYARSTLLLQAEAREARIKALNVGGGLQSFDTLVFATHGLLAGEARSPEPALVLTPPDKASDTDDGLLSASEIASLTLRARLVILSACNTAAGDGQSQDGLAGLARAFFQAGARELLVTHWSVYSRAAMLVSTGYVAHARAEPGLRPAQVLQQVLLTIMDGADPEQQNPSFWAAFAMVGPD